MLFIMTLALQLYTLIQREASNELIKRNEYLEGVMPNNIKTCRPKTDKMLSLFDNIMQIEVNKIKKKGDCWNNKFKQIPTKNTKYIKCSKSSLQY